MTRKGVLQQACLGIALLLIGTLLVDYAAITAGKASTDSKLGISVLSFVFGGLTFFYAAAILWFTLGDWRTKLAFERAFGVALPSWERDINSIQAMKRDEAQTAVAKALRQAKAEFQEAADEENRFKGPKETKKSLAAKTQEKKAIYFGLRKLAEKCGIGIPKDLARLKPAPAEVKMAAK